MIRPATVYDCDQLLVWRNMPEVYELGNGKTVNRTEHVSWFNRALTSNDVMLNIIEPKAGMVRIDRNGIRADISIYLMTSFQGQGIGKKVIMQATENAHKVWKIDVYATIHPTNDRSKRTFEAAGYEKCTEESYVHRYG